jgi:hypothetical protein
MKATLFLVVTIVLCASQAFGQAGTIALYSDAAGADCDIVDSGPGMVSVYVIHTGTPGSMSSRWAAPKPACMTGATWINDTEVMPVTIGDSQTGVAIGYGGCVAGPIHILTINYFAQGLTGTCCEYWVIPDPAAPSGEIEVSDCVPNTIYGQSALATINGDGSCPCGGSAAPSFQSPQGVLGGGGGSMTSENYGTRATVGQAATGTLSGSSYASAVGYWHLPYSTTTEVKTDPVVPKTYSLDQNYPNPFNPTTTIRFTLPEPSRVKLQIFDVKGRLLMTMVDRDYAEGVHEEVLHADGFASGVYFYRMQAGGFTKVQKLVVLK